MAKAPSTTCGPWGRVFSHCRFDFVSFLRVQSAASRAMRLNNSPSSMPEQTLSWLPRIAARGRSFRSMSMAWFGLAP